MVVVLGNILFGSCSCGWEKEGQVKSMGQVKREEKKLILNGKGSKRSLVFCSMPFSPSVLAFSSLYAFSKDFSEEIDDILGVTPINNHRLIAKNSKTRKDQHLSSTAWSKSEGRAGVSKHMRIGRVESQCSGMCALRCSFQKRCAANATAAA